MAEQVIVELRAEIRQAQQAISDFSSRSRQSFISLSQAAQGLGVSLGKLDRDVKQLNLGAVTKASNQLSASFHVSSQVLNSLTGSVRANAQAFNSLTDDMAQFRRQMQQATEASQRFGTDTSRSLDRASRSAQTAGLTFRNFRNILVSLGLFRLGREALDITTNFNRVQRTLHTVTGTAEAGAEAFAFVRAESNRLGTDLLAGARAFASLTNAAKNTRFEGENTRKVFSAMAGATTALGLGTDEYRRVLIATTQILTKGKIFTEELLQLSEAGIPIYQKLSEAIGITGEQLSKALRDGKVPADALLLIAHNLQKDFFEASIRNADTLEVKFRVLTNTVQETISWFGSAVFKSDELKRLVGDLSTLIENFRNGVNKEEIKIFTDNAVRTVRAMADALGTIVALFSDLDAAQIKLGNFFKDVEDLSAKQPEGIDKKVVQFIVDFFKPLAGPSGAIEGTRKDFEKLGELVRKVFSLPEKNNIKQSLEEIQGVIDYEDIDRSLETSILHGTKEGAKKGADAAEKIYKDLANTIRDAIIGEDTGGLQLTSANLKKMMKDLSEEARKTLKELVAGGEYLDEEEALFFKIFNKRNAAKLKAAEELAKQELGILEGQHGEELKLNEERFEADKKTTEAQGKLAGILAKLRTDYNIEFDEKFRASLKKNLEEEKKIAEDRRQLEQDLFDARARTLEDAADNVTQILERIAEDDWIGAIDGFFRFAADGISNIGKQFEALGKLQIAQGRGKELIGLGNVQFGQTLGSVGKVAGGIGAGAGLGAGVAGGLQQIGLPGPAASGIGGAVGGAVGGGVIGGVIAGGTAGSVIPVVGTIVGAVVGAALGVLAGGGFGGGKPATFAEGIRTTPTAPPLGETSDEVFRRSAFGVLSFVEDAARGIAGFADLQTIVDLDNTLAQLLDVEQRRLAQEALANTITGELSGESFGAAAGDVMAQRIGTVIQAVLGGAEGQRVAEQFAAIGPRGGPEVAAQKAAEIFGIINTLTQAMNTEQLTAVELELRNINDTFKALAPVAIDYGFSIDRINAAHLSAIDKLRTAVDQDISRALLAITDPFAASMQELSRQAEDLRRSVIAVGGDMAALNQLIAAQRQQLIDARNEEIKSFALDLRVQLLNLTNQQAAAELQLAIQRDEMIKQALALGVSEAHTAALIADIVKIYQTSVNQLRNPASVPAASRPQGSTGPSRQDVARQMQDFMSATRSDVGRSLQQLRTRFVELAREARRVGLSTNALTRSYTNQAIAIKDAARVQASLIVLSIADPFRAAVLQMQQELQRFSQMASEGIIPKALVNNLIRLSQATTVANEALRRAGGGSSPADQLGAMFSEFVQAGKPLTDAQRQMMELNRQFQNLSSAARAVGLSTRNLEESYLNQARIIRQELIKEIDAQLETQREGIRSINEYLRGQALSDTLPTEARLNAAAAQFQQATRGTDAGAAIEAAEAFKGIAREQFASSTRFFEISRNVDAALAAFRDREQVRIDNERKRQIQVAEMQMRATLAATNSLAVLRQMGATANGSARQLAVLVDLAQRNGNQNAVLEALLRRTLARLETAVR